MSTRASDTLMAVTVRVMVIIRVAQLLYLAGFTAAWSSWYSEGRWGGPLLAAAWGLLLLLGLRIRGLACPVAALDAGVAIGVTLCSSLVLPPEARGDPGSWVFVNLLSALLAAAARYRRAVFVLVALAAAGANLGAAWESGSQVIASTVLVLVVAGLVRYGIEGLSAVAAEADARLAATVARGRAETVAAARARDQREQERVIHDTVLNMLTALSWGMDETGGGRAAGDRADGEKVDQEVRDRCRDSIRTLEEMLADLPGQGGVGLLARIERAVGQARAAGLDVELAVRTPAEADTLPVALPVTPPAAAPVAAPAALPLMPEPPTGRLRFVGAVARTVNNALDRTVGSAVDSVLGAAGRLVRRFRSGWGTGHRLWRLLWPPAVRAGGGQAGRAGRGGSARGGAAPAGAVTGGAAPGGTAGPAGTGAGTGAGTDAAWPPEEVGWAFAGALGEALSNVRRHAGVSRVRVDVDLGADYLRITVADEGAGFDPERVGADGARLGLRHSVFGRVADVGGWAQIFSAPGRGTVVVLDWRAPHAGLPGEQPPARWPAPAWPAPARTGPSPAPEPGTAPADQAASGIPGALVAAALPASPLLPVPTPAPAAMPAPAAALEPAVMAGDRPGGELTGHPGGRPEAADDRGARYPDSGYEAAVRRVMAVGAVWGELFSLIPTAIHLQQAASPLFSLAQWAVRIVVVTAVARVAYRRPLTRRECLAALALALAGPLLGGWNAVGQSGPDAVNWSVLIVNPLFMALIVLCRPVREWLAAMAAATVVVVAAGLGYAGTDPAALGRLGGAVYALWTVQVLVTAFGPVLWAAAETSARAARADADLSARQAAAVAVRADRAHRLARLEEDTLPLLRAIAAGAADPRDPAVRAQCVRQASMLRRMLVTHSSGDPLRELACPVELAEARGLSVTVQADGDLRLLPSEVRRELAERVGQVLAAVRGGRVRLTVYCTPEEATVYLALPDPEVARALAAPHPPPEHGPDRPGRREQPGQSAQAGRDAHPARSSGRPSGCPGVRMRTEVEDGVTCVELTWSALPAAAEAVSAFGLVS